MRLFSILGHLLLYTPIRIDICTYIVHKVLKTLLRANACLSFSAVVESCGLPRSRCLRYTRQSDALGVRPSGEALTECVARESKTGMIIRDIFWHLRVSELECVRGELTLKRVLLLQARGRCESPQAKPGVLLNCGRVKVLWRSLESSGEALSLEAKP